LIEIKSTKSYLYNEKKIQAKIEVTNKYLESGNIDEYFLDENMAQNIGLVFKRTGGIKHICKKLYAEDKLKLYSDKKHKDYIVEK
jgi:hypothetical protein